MTAFDRPGNQARRTADRIGPLYLGKPPSIFTVRKHRMGWAWLLGGMVIVFGVMGLLFIPEMIDWSVLHGRTR